MQDFCLDYAYNSGFLDAGTWCWLLNAWSMMHLWIINLVNFFIAHLTCMLFKCRKNERYHIFCSTINNQFELFILTSIVCNKTRLMVTVDLGTKWVPNSDSSLKFIPEQKFSGY